MRYRSVVVFTLLLFLAPLAQSRGYGHYSTKNIVKLQADSSGAYSLVPCQKLARMLDDLAQHAQYYPPRFDTKEDLARARSDVSNVTRFIRSNYSAYRRSNELLLYQAFLYSIGYNLDLPHAADAADMAFSELLEIEPDNATVHHLYGAFLASASYPTEAEQHLTRAIDGGIVEAHFDIGLTYLQSGRTEQAIRHFEQYAKAYPEDAGISKLITALRSGLAVARKID